ncbi:MAG: PilT/PilU family type 4a pilus ATPase [Actinomycetota bacterium]|nr:PilT/PilU family type 4a pilus ATPase [Actinomycetota bacterium]
MAEKKLLIVHEDADLVEQIKTMLSESGAKMGVISALSAPRALGMMGVEKPDVVVVDGELEGMDGYSLTQQIKASPDGGEVAVVIISLQPSETSAMRARQAGASAHMASGGSVAALVGKVLSLAGLSDNGSGPDPDASPASMGYGVPQQVVASAGAPEAEMPAAGAYGVPQASPPGPATPSPVSSPAETPAPPSGLGVGAEAPRTDDSPHIDDLLRLMIERGGSDLHITVGSPPGVRLRGEIVPVENHRVLMPRDTMEMILNLLSEDQRRRFETELELDFAYSIPGVSRFRANVFQQRNSMGAVFRVIPIKIPTLEELGLPKVARYLAERPRGLVLVTGPTGSGKSTTLAAMINHINETRALHIITLEDPIEFMHKNKKAYVNQREVGEDTHSFASALKRVLRQDPDVILVGEMRDLETIGAAITAAETGHLVLATLHTTGGPATIDRIIDVFPPHQQQQVRMQLSGTLEGVLSQVLLRSTDGRSRVMAMEVMLGIPAIGNLIREGKTHQMATIIQGGASLGMQTLDQHLKTLLQAGKVTFEEAVGKAMSPRELAQMVGRKI